MIVNVSKRVGSLQCDKSLHLFKRRVHHQVWICIRMCSRQSNQTGTTLDAGVGALHDVWRPFKQQHNKPPKHYVPYLKLIIYYSLWLRACYPVTFYLYWELLLRSASCGFTLPSSVIRLNIHRMYSLRHCIPLCLIIIEIGSPKCVLIGSLKWVRFKWRALAHLPAEQPAPSILCWINNRRALEHCFPPVPLLLLRHTAKALN